MLELDPIPFFNLAEALLTKTQAPPTFITQVEKAIENVIVANQPYEEWSSYIERIKLIRLLVLCNQDVTEHINKLSASWVPKNVIEEAISLLELMLNKEVDFKNTGLRNLLDFIISRNNELLKEVERSAGWKRLGLIIFEDNNGMSYKLLLDSVMKSITPIVNINIIYNIVYPYIYQKKQWDKLIDSGIFSINKLNRIIRNFTEEKISLLEAENEIYNAASADRHQKYLALYKLLLIASRSNTRESLLSDVSQKSPNKIDVDDDRVFIRLKQYIDLINPRFLLDLYKKKYDEYDFRGKNDTIRMLNLLIDNICISQDFSELIDELAYFIVRCDPLRIPLLKHACVKFYNKTTDLTKLANILQTMERGAYSESRVFIVYASYLFQQVDNKNYADMLLNIITIDASLCLISPAIAVKLLKLYEILGNNTITFLENLWSSSTEPSIASSLEHLPNIKESIISEIKSCFDSALFAENSQAVIKTFSYFLILLELSDKNYLKYYDSYTSLVSPLSIDIFIDFIHNFKLILSQANDIAELHSYSYLFIFSKYLAITELSFNGSVELNPDKQFLFDWIIPILKAIHFRKILISDLTQVLPNTMDRNEVILDYINYAANTEGKAFYQSYQRASQQLELPAGKIRENFYKLNKENFLVISQLIVILKENCFNFLRGFLNTSPRPLERFFSLFNNPLPEKYVSLLMRLSNIDITRADYINLERLFYIIIGVASLEKELIENGKDTRILFPELNVAISQNKTLHDILIASGNLSKKYCMLLLDSAWDEEDESTFTHHELLTDIIAARTAIPRWSDTRAVFDDIIREVYLKGVPLSTYVLSNTTSISSTIADHNKEIIKILQEYSINTDLAFNYAKTHTFTYTGNATLNLNQNLFAIWQDINNVEIEAKKLQATFLSINMVTTALNNLCKAIDVFKVQITKGSNKETITDADLDVLKKISKESMLNLLVGILKTIASVRAKADKCEQASLISVGFIEHTEHLKNRVTTFQSYRNQNKVPKTLKLASQYEVKMYNKDAIETINLGKDLGCCLSPSGGKFHAMIERMVDMAMFMPVIIDLLTGLPVCGAWGFFANIYIDGKPSIVVVFNFIEMTAGKSHIKELRELMLYQLFSYTLQYMKEINVKYLFARQLTYGNIPPLPIKTISGIHIEKVGGILDGFSDFLPALDKNVFHLCTQANIDAAFPNQVTKPPHQQVDIKALQAYSFINESSNEVSQLPPQTQEDIHNIKHLPCSS
jgi:hypothetical protein